MSTLTIERGQKIAQENIERIYRFPKEYGTTKEYLEKYNGSLRKTLLSILNYIKDKKIVIDKHRYEFFLDNNALTYKVRKKQARRATSNRHINMLCALGLLKKVYQSQNKDILLKINADFLQKGAKRPINVFSFHAYTDQNLREVEMRANRLKSAGITSGNISQNQLVLNGLEDIANEVYYANDRTAPDIKAEEAAELLALMESLCDSYGYVSKSMLYDNLLLPDVEIDKLLRIFKLQLREIYKYAPPTKKEMQLWSLKDRKYIWKRKKS